VCTARAPSMIFEDDFGSPRRVAGVVARVTGCFPSARAPPRWGRRAATTPRRRRAMDGPDSNRAVA